jgi:hypothetical protein
VRYGQGIQFRESLSADESRKSWRAGGELRPIVISSRADRDLRESMARSANLNTLSIDIRSMISDSKEGMDTTASVRSWLIMP